MSTNVADGNCVTVVLAAGSGSRFGGKKQHALLDGKPLWRHVYDTATEVLPPENVVVVGEECAGVQCVAGGERRAESVLAGLEYFAALNPARVIVAEAARPLVTVEQFRVLLDTAAASNTPSAAFVTPLVNAIIRRDGEPVNRDDYWELATPFLFDYDLLRRAYTTGEYFDVTDDTRAVYEYAALKPLLIETGRNLFKVTYPGDLEIAEALLRYYSKRNSPVR